MRPAPASGAAHPDARPPGRRRPLLLAALLAAIVAGVFLPAVNHEFITYDDQNYVVQNPDVTAGLSWAGVRWAFTTTKASNWHPLTWLSHMADCELFDLEAGGHHLTNVLLHALSTGLLFLALQRMTGALWRSLFVAALFGLHPLHVESVAWIAERKDVLSTTFGMLVLWVYAVRAERERGGRPGAWLLYGAALVLFALGLMAKPMLVTLPCVLLLLDFWPLGRWPGASIRARWMLVAEKLPFFALAAAASAMTLIAQRTGGTVASVQDFTLPVRFGNALIAYCRYLGKGFFPAELAVFYPNFARPAPLAAILLAAALLAAVTALALRLRRSRPWLLAGWLWFLGTLVPVIGLVQVGGQAIADRYTYVPLTGLFILVAWSADDLSRAWRGRFRRPALAAAAGATLLVLTALTSRQLACWKNSVTLFRHAAAVTEDNWVAHHNLFIALAEASPVEAQAHFQETLRILAEFAQTYDRRGVELAQIPGRRAEAIQNFRTAIRIIRTVPDPHYHLGLALAQTPGGVLEAIEELRTALQLQPDFAEAHLALADVLAGIPERVDEALMEYRTAIVLDPDLVQARHNLGLLLARLPGRSRDALEQFEKALQADPGFEPAREAIEQLRAVRP